MKEITETDIFVQAVHSAARMNQHYSLSHVSREAHMGKVGYLAYISQEINSPGFSEKEARALANTVAQSINDSLNGRVRANELTIGQKQLLSKKLFLPRSTQEEKEFIQLLRAVHFNDSLPFGGEAGVLAEKRWHLLYTIPSLYGEIENPGYALGVFAPAAIRQLSSFLEGELDTTETEWGDLVVIFAAAETRWRDYYQQQYEVYQNIDNTLLHAASMFHPIP